MSGYTPSTDVIRIAYRRRKPGTAYLMWAAQDHVETSPDAEFDRWLAAHDAEVSAKALEDAVEEFEGSVGPDDLRLESALGGRWTPMAALDAWENQGPFMDWLRAQAAGIREAK